MTSAANTIACEYCGAPLRVTRDRQYRLKYHPICKRTVDRNRANARRDVTAAPSSTEHVCEGCGQTFEAKRKDAKYCSSRCRTAAHRAR